VSVLDEFGLTPAQQMEVANSDQDLVTAWLSATAAARGLKSPVGFFLAGLRSGAMPAAGNDDRIRLARIRMRNLRHCFPTEAEALAEVFGAGGLLHDRDDPNLKAEMSAIWSER
jgi:hypothetical protein